MIFELSEAELKQVSGGGKWTNAIIGGINGATTGIRVCGPWCGVAGVAIGGFIGYHQP